MLTAAQRAKCRVIAAALDAGDQRPWLKAEPSLSVAEKGAVWDARAHVSTGGRGKTAGNLTTDSREGLPKRDIGMTSAGVADLDYWSDTDDAPIDDDVPDDEPTCGACRGSGRDTSGGKCVICGGRGRIPAEDQPDDGDDDEDRRREDTDDDEDEN